MDRRPQASSLAPPATIVSSPPEPPQRLRRRLQKKFLSIRRPAPIDPSVSNKLNTGVVVAAQQAGTVGQPSLRLSPDLSDAKWHAYLGDSNAVKHSGSKSNSQTGPRTPEKPRKVSFDTPAPAIIPEFSHLAVSNLTPRPSLDSSLSSPTSSISTRSSMRRHAKTPIYAIGQLENASYGRSAKIAEKVSSVDLIANQYRDLLETQDTDSIRTDTRPDPFPSRQSLLTQSSSIRSRHSAGETPAELRRDIFSPAPAPLCRVSAYSPRSDDGTLVAFDEEAIYFKPMSFSPEPPSTPPPPPRNCARLNRNSHAQESSQNLSLQIAMDLLTRELSTSMLDRSQKPETDVSSLQIWVMIEAYERLRDQVLEARKQTEEAQNLETVFDIWLKALYTLHDQMTSDAASRGSNYDGADLEAGH
ncbi:hypothetical protein CORC01_04487 [Colletotrichum orchidophilum]|uniref:Mating-type switching protein swi10 n=1 Tax=Colletotrichum orchidophilum TaxID=1209926 RepID=A0A1G4BG23_9PEZI|nr:uncharacterized protein CORC01_04487 [Colletotrichum orchidophilum]OHF00298.1 hypothetical protein CORC01_04487 [Colletotrichum orchidophilum]